MSEKVGTLVGREIVEETSDGGRRTLDGNRGVPTTTNIQIYSFTLFKASIAMLVANDDISCPVAV